MTPPTEPPVFEIPPAISVIDNEPIIIRISAIVAGSNQTEGVEIIVDNVPEFANFSSGNNTGGGRWVFTPEQFGLVTLKLPDDFVGAFSLEVAAMVEGAVRRRNLVIDIQSNMTTMSVTTATMTTDGVIATSDIQSNMTTMSVTTATMTTDGVIATSRTPQNTTTDTTINGSTHTTTDTRPTDGGSTHITTDIRTTDGGSTHFTTGMRNINDGSTHVTTGMKTTASQLDVTSQEANGKNRSRFQEVRLQG